MNLKTTQNNSSLLQHQILKISITYFYNVTNKQPPDTHTLGIYLAHCIHIIHSLFPPIYQPFLLIQNRNPHSKH